MKNLWRYTGMIFCLLGIHQWKKRTRSKPISFRGGKRFVVESCSRCEQTFYRWK